MLFSLLFISCKEEKKHIKAPVQKVVKTKKEKKKLKKEEPKKKELDTINNNNKVAFLTAYGKENPETIELQQNEIS